jgi:hypothetical protein
MKEVKGFISLVSGLKYDSKEHDFIDIGEIALNINNISEVIDYPYGGKRGVKIIMKNGNEYVSTSWWMDEILSRIEHAM